MSWTTTVYEKITSKDGNRSWMTKRVLSKDEFRYPGQRRTTYVDKSGQITRIEIRDDRVGRILELQPASKTAILKMASAAGDQRSPFAFIGDGIRTRKCEGVPVKSVSLQTPRILDGKKVNVVRLAVNAGDGWPAHVFQAMFDQESKGLVCLMTPGGPEFSDIDPDLAVAKSGPAETDFSKVEMARAKHHEIVVNPRIDASEFSLDPPAGYALQTQAKPTVTEEEMVEFLRVAAGLNGGTFPDSTGWWFLADSVWEKKESDRSAAENAAISLKFKFAQKDIYTAPVLVFQEQHTKPDTFCYVGAGVKLGEADRMVCWYQPRNQSKFRVIHGDMSIKELSASELPLNPDK